MPHIDKDTQKDVVKEAIQEWLDEKYKELGKWTLKGIVAMGFAALVYFYLSTVIGWHK